MDFYCSYSLMRGTSETPGGLLLVNVAQVIVTSIPFHLRSNGGVGVQVLFCFLSEGRIQKTRKSL